MIVEFGKMPDGRSVELIQLGNEVLEVGLITLGASLQSVRFEGAQIVLGSDGFDDYLGPLKYSGAIVGRVANRIAAAQTKVAGKLIQLDANEGNGNCLHGGRDGAGTMLWSIADCGPLHAVLHLHMPDNHMGFPGALEVQARYELKGDTLRLEITAQSDVETLCNFATHGYWNLSGEVDINAHVLSVNAKRYLPLDDRQIPTGDIADVAGTEFDFLESRTIGNARLDHNFCIGVQRGDLRHVARLYSPASNMALDVASTEAGLQIYDARHLGRAGLAIEPQAWPDAPNQGGFPSIVLKPGETYRSISEFRLYTAA
ncbi:MAG: aldose epimerase family protein [Planktotalea sp.]|uniref:aldose epimerase family protein n=1 Tax=Planktotalea sp. TaxID=2029877 RepID=UPI003C71DB09